jgi:purine-binding chemotaxis protein CheW
MTSLSAGSVGPVQAASGAQNGLAADDPAGIVGVVSVRVGSQEFALDVMSVREIRGWSPPTPLPRAPAYVLGMCDLRGVIIPIIDLGARLGLEPIEVSSTSVIIVAQIRDRLAGLLVDGVSDLIDVDGDRLQATPEIGSLETSEVIQGIFEIDGRILSLIALEAVIPADLVAKAQLPS